MVEYIIDSFFSPLYPNLCRITYQLPTKDIVRASTLWLWALPRGVLSPTNVSRLETLGMACTWGLGFLSHTFAITIGVLYQGWQHWAQERTERRGAPAAPAAPQITGEKQGHTPKPRQDRLLEVEAICRCISPIHAYCWKPPKFCYCVAVFAWHKYQHLLLLAFFFLLLTLCIPSPPLYSRQQAHAKKMTGFGVTVLILNGSFAPFRLGFLNLWNKNKNTCTTFSWLS